ncbi:MAG TPA: aminotransferase class I/II-fold pyridoxal phosphate-dependent enzyme [Phycisphaerales bacterium]|jgi:cystathionine beta-lyase/cystathionine gamma-synthase|nr:aminotransferase class I/II-fold pyridoxal phosphate-dependent enzyme [Phycisphaerales bacterium]
MSRFTSIIDARIESQSSALPLATRALHGAVQSASGSSPPKARTPRSGPLVGALAQTTTFHQSKIGQTGHSYSRVSNPSVDECEVVLGAIEDAPPAVAFGTGLGAETALFLALLKAGDHAVVGDAIYGGTTRLFRQVLSELGVMSTFVDTSDPTNVERAITPRTKLVFIETPANPTLRLTDIAAIAAVTRKAGVPLAVDNTFLTAVLQRPLELGADISVYSTTKLIEGHSAACGGAIVSRDNALLDKVRWIRKCTGGIQAPLNAWLTTRGLKTLPLRIRQQSKNALLIAAWLAQNPHVAAVNYPGLTDFPQAELAARQHLEGLHGNVISFEVVGGAAAGRRALEGAQLCALVEHVGSVETLLTHPVTMTHADVPPDQRRAAGITDGLIRLSVGLEEPEEVIADLDQAVRTAHLADELGEPIAPEPFASSHLPQRLSGAISVSPELIQKGGPAWLAR